jgi:ATP-binding cassette, subfamily F, member 3
MPLLRVDRLRLTYGATDVLRDLTFQVEPRQRIGIVGANGSGKSSLLKAISGEVIPTAGSLTLAPRSRTGYLAQELEAGPHESVYADALHSRPDIIGLRIRLEGLEAAMARASAAEQAALVEDYGAVQHEYERLDGYAYDNRVSEVLHGVGLTETDQALAPGALSGGQRRRLALARLLLQDADLLLLDEPTNHLDLEAIEWLEEFLRLSRSGMLIVSHDRRFLEHTTDDILELQAGSGEWYPGSYRQYLRLRRERRAVQQKEYEAQQQYIARTEEFIRRYKAGQRAREARGRQTKLDRLARVAPPANDEQIRIRLRASVTSELIFQSDGLKLVYPSPSGSGAGWELAVPAFTISAGERVAIVGPNGSGKTSLLKSLLGELRPKSGRVRLGPRVTMRYYDQHLADLDPNKTVLTELQDAFGLPEETLRTFLGRLLFSGDDAFKTIRSLSGGEKSRVALAKLMLDDAGLLLLDEPTNHLDIPAQEMLEEALEDFEGTIVFVSHDRYFIDAIATRLWVVGDGAVTMHLGNYSDLERRRQRATRPVAAEPRASARTVIPQRGVKAKALAAGERVEDQIDALEAQIRQIEAQLADHQTYDDPARVADLSHAHEDASHRLRALYQEWEQAAGE